MNGKSLIVRPVQMIQAGHDHLPLSRSGAPEAQGCEHIARGDRTAIVKAQPVAQLEAIDQPVLGHRMAVDHLRARDVLFVDPEQRVIDHQAVIGRRYRRRPIGIEDFQILFWRDLQNAGFRGAPPSRCRDRKRHG
jgi:hypothetical protein